MLELVEFMSEDRQEVRCDKVWKMKIRTMDTRETRRSAIEE
jgi:hypothetical protein